MILLSHISYPALFFMVVAQLFGISYSVSDILILIFFSALPDLDFLVFKVFKRQKFDDSLQHHKWFTHWPIVYSPLLVLLFIFPNLKLSLICLGIFPHFILDSFLSGDGIMWACPFSNKFLNLFSKKQRIIMDGSGLKHIENRRFSGLIFSPLLFYYY